MTNPASTAHDGISFGPTHTAHDGMVGGGGGHGLPLRRAALFVLAPVVSIVLHSVGASAEVEPPPGLSVPALDGLPGIVRSELPGDAPASLPVPAALLRPPAAEVVLASIAPRVDLAPRPDPARFVLTTSPATVEVASAPGPISGWSPRAWRDEFLKARAALGRIDWRKR